MTTVRPAPFLAASMLALVALMAAGPALADGSTVAVQGQLETQQGGLSSGGEHALERYRAEVRAHWQLDTDWSLTGRLSATHTDRLDVGHRRRVEVDELVLNGSFGNCLGKAGRQTVVWGQADRLRVLDTVHPFDLDESYFGSWENKRLPLAMLNLECSWGDNSLQWLLVPETRFNRRPGPFGRFSLTQPEDLLAAAGLPVRRADDPSASDPSDWSQGLRLTGRMGSLDYALHAFHGWEEDRAVAGDAVGGYVSASQRSMLLGVSFSAPVGPLIARGEAALRKDVTQYGVDAAGLPLAARVDQQAMLLGLDYHGTPWFLSMQWFGQRSEPFTNGPDSRIQRVVTLAARHSSLQDRLTLGLYLAFDLANTSRYASVELQYELDPHWSVGVVLERFSGSPAGFGRFSGQGRNLLQLRYAF